MTKRTFVALASVVMVTGLVLTPDESFADRRHHGRGHGHGHGHGHSPKLHHVLPHHVKPPHRHHHHHFGSRPFVNFGVAPPFLYGPSPIYVTPRRYYDPYYDPWAYAPPPPPVYEPAPVLGGSVSVAPPPPNVVEFPNGRYELRGDGITTPYQWVWIPNPPPGPPSDAPPAPSVPDAPPAPSSAPAASSTPRAKLTLYRWTDADGAVHWTDRYDAIPERYRAHATKH